MTPHRRRLRVWAPWAVLLVVAAAALAVGARPTHRPVTLEQRTLSVASQLRCPVCNGETVAESSTAASADIRNVIRRDLQQGRSPVSIERSLAAVYGTAIYERPPGTLIWAVPAAVVVVAAALLVGLFVWWRPRRRVATADDRLLVEGALGPETGGRGP